MKNQAEIENWNGAIGERWAAFQEVLDARMRAHGEQVIATAGLREGMRVLDVGAGCGDIALDAARTVGPSGRVVGVDVSRPMLARARERATAISNLDFVEHDAALFTADAPFDAIVSRFGVMFFDDPGAAFANIHRAIKPGGSLTFACWKSLAENPWAAVPLAAVLEVMPPQPTAVPNAPGPFAFADQDRVRALLSGAGWKDVTFTPFLHPMILGTTFEDALEYSSRMGPAARLLRLADDATRERALEALKATVAPLAPDFSLASAVWIVTAKG
jgi:ubiquinone/menaquinone biosynthesis C-methylase UbiE